MNQIQPSAAALGFSRAIQSISSTRVDNGFNLVFGKAIDHLVIDCTELTSAGDPRFSGIVVAPL